MFNLSKYRQYDYITIKGIDAKVYRENEHGELINPEICKDFSYFKHTSVICEDMTITNNNRDISPAQWFIDTMNNNFYFETPQKITDYCICGDTIQFWNRENGNGESDENGVFFVLYTLIIEINRIQTEENDLHFMFVEMEW